MSAVGEEVVRKLGGKSVLGATARSQAQLALALGRRLPLVALKGLAGAGFTEQEIERFVIPQRTRRHRADKKQPLRLTQARRAAAHREGDFIRLLSIPPDHDATYGKK